MGKTKYNRAKDFLEKLKEENGDNISFPLFLKKAKMELGMDEERTTKPYLNLMKEFDLIEIEGANVRIK